MNKTLSEVFPDSTTFEQSYLTCGLPTKLLTGSEYQDYSISTIYALLMSNYSNSYIKSSDENRFKFEVMSIIFQYGPIWQKEMVQQSKILNLIDEDLLTGSKAIHNHAMNPGSQPSTATLSELEYIDSQNTTSYVKNKVEGYAQLQGYLDSNITRRFMDKFKKLFIVVLYPIEEEFSIDVGGKDPDYYTKSQIDLKTANLQTQIDNNRGRLDDYEPQIEANTTMSTENRARIELLEASGGGGEVNLSNYYNKTEIDTKITNIQTQVDSNETLSTQNKGRLDQLEPQVEANTTRSTENRTRIEALEASGGADLTNYYTKSQIDTKTGNLQTQITNNRDRLDDYELQIEANTTMSTENRTRIETLEANTVDLTNYYNKTEVDTKTGQLQTQITTNKNNIDSLTPLVNANTTRSTENRTRIEALEASEPDLSNYYTKTETDTKITNSLSTYATKEYVDNKVGSGSGSGSGGVVPARYITSVTEETTSNVTSNGNITWKITTWNDGVQEAEATKELELQYSATGGTTNGIFFYGTTDIYPKITYAYPTNFSLQSQLEVNLVSTGGYDQNKTVIIRPAKDTNGITFYLQYPVIIYDYQNQSPGQGDTITITIRAKFVRQI